MVSAGLPAAVFLRLAHQATQYNRRHGLTGRLVLKAERFLHVIEGRHDLVMPLAARILADRRHGAIEIRAFGGIAARQHDGWSVEGFDRFGEIEPALAHGLRLAGPTPVAAPGLVAGSL